MSILIKGINMPKKGELIDIVITGDGTVRYYDAEKEAATEAVDLHDHGDLVDKDVIISELMRVEEGEFNNVVYVEGPPGYAIVAASMLYDNMKSRMDLYLRKSAPVVIPAERSGCEGRAD